MLRADTTKVTGILFHPNGDSEEFHYYGTHYELYDALECESVDMCELYGNHQLWYDGDMKNSTKETNHNATRILLEQGRFQYYPDIGPFGIRGKAILLRVDEEDYFIDISFRVSTFSMLS